MMRPIPRVLRLLRQGIPVHRGVGHPIVAQGTLPASMSSPGMLFPPAATAEESCAATARAVAYRAFSTSPTPADEATPEPAAAATSVSSASAPLKSGDAAGSGDTSTTAGAAPRPRGEGIEGKLVHIEGENVLRVSRNTIPRVLAAKVSGVLTTGGAGTEVIITAVGAQALFTSARALALVNEDRAAAGTGPVVVTEIRDIGARNAKAFVVSEPDPSLGVTHGTAEEFDPERRFSLRRENKKSVAPVAGALKHAVMTAAKPIQVSSVGAVATSHAVFATFLATSWARESDISTVILPGRQLLEGAGENGSTLGVIRMVVVRTCDAVPEEAMQRPPAE